MFFSLQATQLRSELVSCTEERDDLSQSLAQWREKVHRLEMTNSDTRGLISILEDDIRAGKKEYGTLQSNVDKVRREKQQVCERKSHCSYFIWTVSLTRSFVQFPGTVEV